MSDRIDRLSRLVGGDDDGAGLVLDGRYEILRRLARGGMGEVFEAVDRKLGRRVAVKAVSSLDPSLASRLAAEARTIASIDDPGIATVHDAGLFPDGRLYVVMRLVTGRTLEEVREPRQLAALVADACDVVQRAHERGIVHRDLKPANVMVDEAGRVVVLDWGLAALHRTSGDAAGTQGYTAPEQWLGAIVDARSDVFSLGRFLPDAPAELAAIAAKATQNSPSDRYPSAAALGADLRRWLRGEAVTARVDVGYRLRKSVGRHRLAAVVGAFVFLAVPVLGLLMRGGDRSMALFARTGRALAEAEAHRSHGDHAAAERALKAGLESVGADEAAHARLFRARLLRALGRRREARVELDAAESLAEARFERGLMRVEDEDVSAAEDFAVDVSTSPLVDRADVEVAKGELERLRGNFDGAVRILEKAPGAAAKLAMARVHWQRGDLAGVIEWATRAIEERGHLAEAYVLRSRARLGSGGEIDRAERDAERAIAVGGETAGAYIALGNAALHRKDRAGAEKRYARAVELEPGNAVALANWGVTLAGLGRESEAVRALDEAVRVAPANAVARCNRGSMRLAKRDLAGALEDYEAAAASSPLAQAGRAAVRLLQGDLEGAEEDAKVALRRDPKVVRAHLVLAELALRAGEAAVAEAEASAAIELETTWSEGWALRGAARFRLGRMKEAESDCTAALSIHPKAASVWTRRGMTRAGQGRWTEAIKDYGEALQLEPRNGDVLANRAFARMMAGELEEALADCNVCLELNPADVEVLHHRAVIRMRMADADGGRRDLDEVLRLKPEWAEPRARRALLRMQLGDAEGAREDARQAIKGELHPELREEVKRVVGE